MAVVSVSDFFFFLFAVIFEVEIACTDLTFLTQTMKKTTMTTGEEYAWSAHITCWNVVTRSLERNLHCRHDFRAAHVLCAGFARLLGLPGHRQDQVRKGPELSRVCDWIGMVWVAVITVAGAQARQKGKARHGAARRIGHGARHTPPKSERLFD